MPPTYRRPGRTLFRSLYLVVVATLIATGISLAPSAPSSSHEAAPEPPPSATAARPKEAGPADRTTARLVLAGRADQRRPSLEVGVQFHGVWDYYTWASRRKVLDRLAAMGATWVRMDVGWGFIEPQRGQIDLDGGVAYVDRIISMARRRDLKVLVTLWRTPGWANGGRSATTPPDNPADYARVFAWSVDHWKGDVAAWEVWNEPNLESFYAGTDPVRYTQMLCGAYRSAKVVDPGSRVVFGGPAYVDLDWIRRVYNAGGESCYDVLAVHPYVSPGDVGPDGPVTGESWEFGQLAKLGALLRSRKDSRPVWLTEFGWSTHRNTPSTPQWEMGVTRRQQARYAIAALKLLRTDYPFVRKAFWYNETDLGTGVVHQDSYGLMTRSAEPKRIYRRLRDYLRR